MVVEAPSSEPARRAGLRRIPARAWIVLAAVAGAGMVLAVAGWLRASATAFDPVRWRNATDPESRARERMADALIARGDLLGLTRAEVVGMLGEPPSTAYFSDWDLVYRLGPERGSISVDSEWLVIRLSGDGRVVDARTATD